MNKELTYATVCSGVECMSVAAMGLPMRPVFFSEIEPFPCAVLRHHFPNVPNLGDMSKIEIKDIDNETKEITNGRTTFTLRGGLDVFAGGTPCQDVSVAGKRRGMQEGSGTRSSLAFEFVRLIKELEPRYVLWENVAGVLSDESFPKFLTALAQCGYSVAYRTFDAQFVTCADIDGADAGMDGDGGIELSRAVPQRRRRVWVLGSRIERRLGADVADPCSVLFEPASVLGDHPPCRKSREEIAAALGGRAGVHDRVVEVSGVGHGGQGGAVSPSDGVMPTLVKDDAKGPMPAVIERRVHIYENHAMDSRVTEEDGVSQTLNKQMWTGGGNVPIVSHDAVGMAQNSRDEVRIVGDGKVAGALAAEPGMKQQTYVVTNSNGGDVMPSVTANEAKLGGDNQHNNGGGVRPHPEGAGS